MTLLSSKNLPVAALAVWILAIIATGCVPGDDGASGPERPNILFVLADDWSWPHAGAYGDTVLRTPNFDRVARDGILFTNAFSPSPTCTPSRVGILTGQYPHRLNEGANHMIRLPKDWPVYTELLEAAGYVVGRRGKGCNPGSFEETSWEHDPAGKSYSHFVSFLDSIPKTQPFCFWLGSAYPHRPYRIYGGFKMGMDPEAIDVPAYLPDTPVVRKDLLDYYLAVKDFDNHLGLIMRTLETQGRISNTILVVTSDNGMPFPRAKGSCYDAGTRVPLAIRWPARTRAGRVSDAFVNLCDLAPTFLEAAGLKPPKEMTGNSLLDIIKADGPDADGFFKRLLKMSFGRRNERDRVYLERERHALGRGDGQGRSHMSYPIRAIRTERFLYVRNFRPELWPACDPPTYADVDGSPTKDEIVKLGDAAFWRKKGVPQDQLMNWYFEICFGKRPAEELYDLEADPDQLFNVADKPEYAKAKKKLSKELMKWMRKTDDPRADGEDDRWDYYGFYRGDDDPIRFARPEDGTPQQ